MDPRLLNYYNQELQYIREEGREFAKEFPKIAGRLGFEGIECHDPYVERLLEGFAFLAARVQLKIDSRFPRFTQHLLETLYPDYLAPTPSMAIAQFTIDPADQSLAAGYTIPRHTPLRTRLRRGDRTACEYRTAHEVTLWPLAIEEANYLTDTSLLPGGGASRKEKPRAGLRLRVSNTTGEPLSNLPVESLPLYLHGSEGLGATLCEQLISDTTAIVAEPVGTHEGSSRVSIDPRSLRHMGFEDGEAILPCQPRSFSGYRLLHEYFAFPARYRFVELGGLSAAVCQCRASAMDVTLLFRRRSPSLVDAVDREQFALFCTPIVNLFPRRSDRIHLQAEADSYHVVPDRTRPMDFEVHSVTGVEAYGASSQERQLFSPLYALRGAGRDGEQAYYALERVPRVLSDRQRLKGTRSSYQGQEVYISLVDPNEAPYRSGLRQLAVDTLCTNRDLPQLLTLGEGDTDFTMELGAPITGMHCLAGPSRPRPAYPEGEALWRLIGHLNLGYLSLSDKGEQEGAAALRELLTLYGNVADPSTEKQIEGVRSVRVRSVYRRLPAPGQIVFGRGQEITLECEDSAFEGSGVFLLGAVMERFFARYVSLNAFTQTVLHTIERGEVYRWPARSGTRQTL